MAHIILRPVSDDPGDPRLQLVINGQDFTNEVFAGGVELVSVGDDERYAAVGVKVTFALSRLDLGGDEDVQVTDHLPSIAQRVHSLVALEVGGDGDAAAV